MQSPTIHAPQRLVWIDFLRGLAVLGMIEAHSVNSFLDPSYRSGPWFAAVSYLNGWVAPTFLFVAGYLQGAALRRNWIAHKSPVPRLRSLGLILLIGYGLQFPWDALAHLVPASAGGWEMIHRSLARIDILHCLSVSLVALLLSARLFKKQLHYDLAILVFTLILVASAPFIWAALPLVSHPFAPLLSYLSPSYGALFPLIPWFAFAAAGTLASRFSDTPSQLRLWGNGEARCRLTPFRFPLFAFFTTAALGWLCKWTLAAWQIEQFPGQNYAVRYDAFFFRLSLVLLSCSVCTWLARPSPRSPSIFRFFPSAFLPWVGRKTLPLYVWHLILLHSGLGLVPPLRTLFPRTHTPLVTFWLYLLTLAGTLALTWLWQTGKAEIEKRKVNGVGRHRALNNSAQAQK